MSIAQPEELKAKKQLQQMIDELEEEKLTKLIELSDPDKDEETGEYILGYDQLSPDKRDSFRRHVEQLLREQQAEKAQEAKMNGAEPPKEGTVEAQVLFEKERCPRMPPQVMDQDEREPLKEGTVEAQVLYEKGCCPKMPPQVMDQDEKEVQEMLSLERGK